MNLDLHGGHAGLYFGLYERELAPYLRRLCAPGARCFDVGGQYGYDALVMANLTGGLVLSFECDLELSDQIAQNAAANPKLAHLIQVVSAFVTCRSDSEVSLALDDIAEVSFMPDVIKIDIEGGEVDALIGAERILAKRMPSMIIEVHSAKLETTCIDLLLDAGYTPVVVNQRRWFPDYRPIEHNRWLVAPGRR